MDVSLTLMFLSLIHKACPWVRIKKGREKEEGLSGWKADKATRKAGDEVRNTETRVSTQRKNISCLTRFHLLCYPETWIAPILYKNPILQCSKDTFEKYQIVCIAFR